MATTRILVVDDDQIVLETCRRILEPEGYEVSLVSSASKAIEAMGGDGFDLLLVDVKMPVRDGISLIREVRERWPTVPVVVTTGYPVPETIDDGMRLGAAGYVAKPFTPDELLRSIRAALKGE